MHTAFTTANVDQGLYYPTIWISDYQGNAYVPPSNWLNDGTVSGVPRSLVYVSDICNDDGTDNNLGGPGPIGFNSTSLGEEIRDTYQPGVQTGYTRFTTLYWTRTTIETVHSQSTDYRMAGWIIL